MATESETASFPPGGQPAEKHGDGIEMPLPTAYPFVLSVGLTLFGFGLASSLVVSAVGLVIFILGIIGWVSQMLPGRGHGHEAPAAVRPQPVVGRTGLVEQLKPGLPGYRFRLPEKVHPISAGIWGGLLGGLFMPIPALLYGFFSGKGIWLPVNLLAGMVVPGIAEMGEKALGQFHPGLFVLALCIHAAMAVVFGLMYGVLLPMLPDFPRPLAWGGLLMPLLWTGVSFSLMKAVNPVLNDRVAWPWFLVSQFVFGVVAALTIMRARSLGTIPAGILCGLVGGLLMAGPALLWSLAAGHGLWYPVNLLAGMVRPEMGKLSLAELEQFNTDWLATSIGIHAVLSLGFGLIYALVLPKLPAFPGPLAWGGLLMPLLWTGVSYGMMGVVDPALEKYVEWEYFLISQIVFGVAASIVVLRTQQVAVPPVGGSEPLPPQGGQP